MKHHSDLPCDGTGNDEPRRQYTAVRVAARRAADVSTTGRKTASDAGLIDTLLELLADALAPRVAAAVVERLRAAEAPRVKEPVGLCDKQTTATWLGISVPTLDRHVRSGAPKHQVGARRRFCIAEVRAWLEARGRRAAAPNTSGRVKRDARHDDAELDDDVRGVAAAAGIRSA